MSSPRRGASLSSWSALVSRHSHYVIFAQPCKETKDTSSVSQCHSQHAHPAEIKWKVNLQKSALETLYCLQYLGQILGIALSNVSLSLDKTPVPLLPRLDFAVQETLETLFCMRVLGLMEFSIKTALYAQKGIKLQWILSSIIIL